MRLKGSMSRFVQEILKLIEMLKSEGSGWVFMSIRNMKLTLGKN